MYIYICTVTVMVELRTCARFVCHWRELFQGHHTLLVLLLGDRLFLPAHLRGHLHQVHAVWVPLGCQDVEQYGTIMQNFGTPVGWLANSSQIKASTNNRYWTPPKCHGDWIFRAPQPPAQPPNDFVAAPGTPSAQGYHQCKQGCAGKPSSTTVQPATHSLLLDGYFWI
jgi:hypothetical protein